MSLQRLSRQMEQDVSYLLWRASVYHQSRLDLQQQFAALACSYRTLVPAEQQDQLEVLIANYRAQLN